MLTMQNVETLTELERCELFQRLADEVFGDLSDKKRAARMGVTAKTYLNWKTRKATNLPLLLLSAWKAGAVAHEVARRQDEIARLRAEITSLVDGEARLYRPEADETAG